MPNYLYLDANGQKQGPVNDLQLQALVAQGIITPDTPLATDTGHKGKAGQIPGLFATAPSPFVQSAQQSIAVPVAEKTGGASWQVTLIGLVLILIVAGVGWSIINSQQPETANKARVAPVNNEPVVPMDNEQNNEVQVAVPNKPNQPDQNPPQVQAPKTAVSNQTDELSSPEAIKIGQKIDYINQHNSDGTPSKWKTCDLTESERDVVILYLLRVKKKRIDDTLFEYYHRMSSFLTNLNRVKTNKAIDQYVCNYAHTKESLASQDRLSKIEGMLPESNKLSGNKHDAEENSRLVGKDLFR